MINKITSKVNYALKFAYPQFSLPVTVVDPFRGFMRPALRASPSIGVIGTSDKYLRGFPRALKKVDTGHQEV